MSEGMTKEPPFGHAGAHVYLWNWAVQEVCHELDLLAEAHVCLCRLVQDPSLLLHVHATFFNPHPDPRPLLDHIEKAVANGLLKGYPWERRIDWRAFPELTANDQLTPEYKRLQVKELNFREADELLRVVALLGRVKSLPRNG